MKLAVRFFSVIVFALLLVPVITKGQEPVGSGKQALIKELLDVTEANKTATKMIDSVVEAMNAQYRQMVERLADADTNMTPAQREEVKLQIAENQAKYSTELMRRIKQRVDIGQVIEDISSSLYEKYFSENELRDLISFYKTATGRKTLSVLPQLFAESIRNTSEKLSPILTSIITEMASEEKERLKHIK